MDKLQVRAIKQVVVMSHDVKMRRGNSFSRGSLELRAKIAGIRQEERTESLGLQTAGYRSSA